MCSDTLVATASPDQASNSASTAFRAGRRERISAANRAAIWSIAARNFLRSPGPSCRDSRCHSTPTPRCLSTAAASAWETSGNRSSSAVVNASSRVSSAAPTTVASRSCLPRKCRYSADGPIATASATSPMATLPYPLRQNRSVAASMISCRRFDGRVPRAGRTTAFCTGPAVISPQESHGFEVLDGLAKSGNLVGGVVPIFHPQFAFEILPAPTSAWRRRSPRCAGICNRR